MNQRSSTIAKNIQTSSTGKRFTALIGTPLSQTVERFFFNIRINLYIFFSESLETPALNVLSEDEMVDDTNVNDDMVTSDDDEIEISF